jgi:hypothetical protein
MNLPAPPAPSRRRRRQLAVLERSHSPAVEFDDSTLRLPAPPIAP